MNSRWVTLVSVSLVAFASLVIACQFKHYNGVGISSIIQSYFRGKQQSEIPSMVDRNQPASGMGPELDLVLPKDARVFMPDMTGPTNYGKIGYYYHITYYLFPR